MPNRANVDVNSLPNVAAPNLDDDAFEESDFTSGALSADACKRVLMALWPACIVRPELLWTVNTLAREVTRLQYEI